MIAYYVQTCKRNRMSLLNPEKGEKCIGLIEAICEWSEEKK
jgi:hypothetical protein